MTRTETQRILDALLSLDPDALFEDWENGEGEDCGELLRDAVKICKASIVQVVEPVAYCVSLDGKTVYSNLSCDRDYVDRMANVVGGTAHVMALRKADE